MVAAFDHLDQGTPESAWLTNALADLPRLTVPAVGARLLIVAAHPDDESLGAGGLIAAAAEQGAAIDVFIATDGEASHPHSLTHSPKRLAALRRAEVTAALAVLAPMATITWLSLPDGQLHAHRERLVAALASPVDACTHVVSPWSGDRHPDHEACAEAVREILANRADIVHWQYPIWAWHWADPSSAALPWARLHRLDLGQDVRRTKLAAMECHRSQHTPLSAAPGDAAILPARVVAHFERDFETFVVETTRPAVDPDYFDALYESTDDPWGLGERFYEARKRELLLASLPRRQFQRAFEPGCATGLLTASLAERCDELVAWDGAAAAAQQTCLRLADRDAVRVERRRIPADWPDGDFDLIVLSEVAYYCADLGELVARVLDSLSSDGVVVACHWRHEATDHPHTAQEVHGAIAASGLRALVHHTEADFLLGVWSRDGESVAQAEGILG